MNITSLKPAQERDYIKEIDFLKKSLVYVKRMDEIKPKRDELYERMKEAQDHLNKIKPKLDEYSKLLDTIKADQEESKKLRETNKEGLDELEQKIQVIKDQIAKIFEEKIKVKEEYYHKKFDFAVEQDEVKHIEFLIRRKEKLVKDEEYKKKREEQEKSKLTAMLASMPNPFQDEIALADSICSYLTKTLQSYERYKA